MRITLPEWFKNWLDAPERPKPGCPHVWEACRGGTLQATRFICSRCDGEIIAPVKTDK